MLCTVLMFHHAFDFLYLTFINQFCLLVFRCEECRYEGEVYVDGQVFTSKQDPRLRCQCSVSVYKSVYYIYDYVNVFMCVCVDIYYAAGWTSDV